MKYFDFYFIVYCLPIFAIFLITVCSLSNVGKFSLLISGVILILNIIYFGIFYNWSYGGVQLVKCLDFIQLLGINFCIGVDMLSIVLILLTHFSIFISISAALGTKHCNDRVFFILLFIIEFILEQVWKSIDLFFFYIFFEAVLIPMFLLIVCWGKQERKVYAGYQFFLFTLFGSFFFLVTLYYIYNNIGFFYKLITFEEKLTLIEQLWVGLAMIITFGVKIPLYPVHIWLPEAHVEAPTEGSILLAGVLLKMGAYGILKYVFILCLDVVDLYAPLIFVISVIGGIYTSLIALRQSDAKKIIAYSSIGHMGFIISAIFTNFYVSLVGGVFLMLIHGIVSPALFYLIGIIYERYGSRFIPYYGGLVRTMPIYSLFLFYFIFSNLSFPGTANFIGEFLIILGLVSTYSFVGLVLFCSGVIVVAYNLMLLSDSIYGPDGLHVHLYKDLTFSELFCLSLMFILMLILGFFPMLLLYNLGFGLQYVLFNLI